MGSYNEGKDRIAQWLKDRYTGTCLDVGACDGKWFRLLGDHFIMDAVEIFPPNCKKLGVYRNVFNGNILDYEYDYYDVILFCDVIEHMTVSDAQTALNYAKTRCKDMIVAVPWLYSQDAIYGNPWEVHIQNDLTERIFEERYPGFECILQPKTDYAYYHLKRDI